MKIPVSSVTLDKPLINFLLHTEILWHKRFRYFKSSYANCDYCFKLYSKDIELNDFTIWLLCSLGLNKNLNPKCIECWIRLNITHSSCIWSWFDTTHLLPISQNSLSHEFQENDSLLPVCAPSFIHIQLSGRKITKNKIQIFKNPDIFFYIDY